MQTLTPTNDIVRCAAMNALAMTATRKPADIAFDNRWGRDCAKSNFRYFFGEIRALAKGAHRFGSELSATLAEVYRFNLGK